MSNLTNIFLPVQRIIPFSNVEGIGNRTSIFLQGCNINCLYCHNPETIALTSPTAGYYSLAELLVEIQSAVPFIRGITVSGGEPTLYAKELTILFREVHKLGLTCYIDSNGFFAYEAIVDLIEETDKFLFDIKGSGNGLANLCFSKKYMKPKDDWQTEIEYTVEEAALPKDQAADSPHIEKKARQKQQVQELLTRAEGKILTGMPPTEITERNFLNLKKLLPLDKVEEIRLVYIKGFYDEKETVKRIAKLAKDYPKVLFKLIRVHAKGARGAKEIAAHMPTAKEVDDLANFAKAQGLNKQFIIH